MHQVKPTMGGAMPGTATPGASVSICLPMARGTHLREAFSNSWGSSTASGTQAPLEPAQGKEGMVHTSPGSSRRDASILRRKRCSWQCRKGETAQLAPRTASSLCSHPVPSPGHPAHPRLSTWHTPLHSHQTLPSEQSRRHSEITIKHLYQRSWC